MEFCVKSINQYGRIVITSNFSSLLTYSVYPSSFYYIGLTCSIKSISTFKIFYYIAFIKCKHVHIRLCTYLGHLWKSGPHVGVRFCPSTTQVLGTKFRLSGLIELL